MILTITGDIGICQALQFIKFAKVTQIALHKMLRTKAWNNNAHVSVFVFVG